MYYTTHEVSQKLPNYNSARTLLKALHNNQKLDKKEDLLSKIWDCRIRLGKRWLYPKLTINTLITNL